MSIRCSVSVLLITLILSYPFSANPHGGEFPTISHSRWELTKYKYTELLRTEPLCWTPWESYVAVNRYVDIEVRDNIHWLIIGTDLTELIKADAEFNKSHARKYKGKPKTRLKKIYRYCHKTEYVAHVKTARDVFEKRQGDCAGISSAFYVLCKKNKIPCRYIIGWTDTGCHAWNRVKIGRKWYWIDCTQGKWISRKLWKGYSVMEMW